jgi:outer membrane receptor protein involved in Fe transport
MAQTAAAAGGSTQVGELIVTGSHIPKPNLDQPTPVQALTTQLIQNSGVADLGDIIGQLPSMGVNSSIRGNSNSFGNAGGLSFADLRNLGSNRTLVLVDGQRHVAGDPGSAAVDLGSIPPALVDRVEIVTGGASAIYGSDALAGVVNIILKKNFQGVEGAAQAGILAPGGGGANTSVNLTVGRNFDHDRGNLAVTVLWDRDAGVEATKVRSLHNYATIVNPNDLDPTTGAPIPGDGITDTFLAPNVLAICLTRIPSCWTRTPLRRSPPSPRPAYRCRRRCGPGPTVSPSAPSPAAARPVSRPRTMSA